MGNKLTQTEQNTLLIVARQSMEKAVQREPLLDLNLEKTPPALKELRSSFVTLTIEGVLRGCIGALDPYLPLIKDVQEHAVAAAVQDFRFPRVQPAELPFIRVEVSVLTPRSPLKYALPEDLPLKISPNVDGVILQDGYKKATFLPQVWEKLPNPEDFLFHLCMKMGVQGDLWRRKVLTAYIYQVQSFGE